MPGKLLHVIVKPKARQNSVTSLPDGSLKVCVTAAPTGGRANRAVTALLAAYFRLPKREIVPVRGTTGRHKYFSLPEVYTVPRK